MKVSSVELETILQVADEQICKLEASKPIGTIEVGKWKGKLSLEEFFRTDCCHLKEMSFELRDSTRAYFEGDWILVEDGMLHFDGLRSESGSQSFQLTVGCQKDTISVDFHTEVVKSRRLTNTQCTFGSGTYYNYVQAGMTSSITLPSATDADGDSLTYSYKYGSTGIDS